MRFGILLFASLVFCGSGAALAKPGDTLQAGQNKEGETVQTETVQIMQRRARSSDTPFVPEGFAAQNIAKNLGKISAIGHAGTDLFVLEQSSGQLFRLRDRDQDGDFELRSKFLIGFDRASSIAVNKDFVFVADAAGVWQIKTGTSMSASAHPKNILPLAKNKYTSGPRPLALSQNGHLLYVGLTHAQSQTGQIIVIDLTSRAPSIFTSGNWQPKAFAINPAGQVLVGLETKDGNIIAPIKNRHVQILEGLKLAEQTSIEDLKFWQGGVLMALGGVRPMLALAEYEYGTLSAKYTVVIDGFSRQSLIRGRREIWGLPSAITILPNEKFIFAEQNGGALWSLVAQPGPPEIPKAIALKPKPKTKPALESKTGLLENPKKPLILMGSSIESASIIKTDDQLKRKKKETQIFTMKTPNVTRTSK
ncbi:MAG: hypothetical protein V3U57_09995 [Robiginitomaculum sp.]